MKAFPRKLLGAAAVAAALLGCNQADSDVQPATFDRPGDVAFVCFDETQGTVVALSSCADVDEEDLFSLIALVTQTARGEVASVNLTEGDVLDINTGIPGFTFVRVLPDPAAIVVPPDGPSRTYVASFGARRVEAIATARFIPDAVGEIDPSQEVLLPGAPTDMVLGPDGGSLYVAVPERTGCTSTGPADGGTADGGASDGGTSDACAGGVYRIPLDEMGGMGSPQEVLTAGDVSVPPPVDLRTVDPLPMSAQPAAYQLVCSDVDPPAPLARVAPPEPVFGEGFRPMSLRVDDRRGHLLVADEGLPVVHRVDVNDPAAPAVLAPMNVGVPTRSLVITPPVAPTVDAPSTAEPVRYVYAIDDTDQTVLAVDYTDGSPSFGAVLPVATGAGPATRLKLPADVRVLEIVTPDADAPLCSPSSEFAAGVGPTQLRGVFLAAGLSDGTLRIVDVEDRDAPCRFCQQQVREEDVEVYIRRHSPRIGGFVNQSFELAAAPLFALEGASARVLETGQPESGSTPGLAPLAMGCPAGMTQVYPEAGAESLVCVLADPWALRVERWSATWNGVIPDTEGGGGLLQDGSLHVSGVDLCDRGVLGAADVPVPDGDPATADDPLTAYAGDVLVITSELPAATEDDPDCAPFAGELEDRDEIGFRITSASQTELVLAAQTLSGIPFDRVASCFRNRVSYAVRTNGTYTVAGSISGFLHPVVATATGECMVDPDAGSPTSCPVAGGSTCARGRAFQGEPFVSSLISFQIPFFTEDGASPPRGAELQLLFDVTAVPPVFGLQLGTLSTGARVPVLPAALRYNPLNQNLYLVDIANRGLLELGLVDFQLLQTFE